MSKMLPVLCSVIALLTMLASAPLGAHESRPIYVEISETEPGRFKVAWKPPATVSAVATPEIIMPDSCSPLTRSRPGQSARVRHYSCPNKLSGETIAVSHGPANPSVSTLFFLNRLSGESHSQLLGPDESEWIIPPPEQARIIAGGYLRLGIAHILTGYDHLLFVTLLILLTRTWKRTAIVITGFTIAHSITLALAALDLVALPAYLVEALIALSIVFVATELARDRRDTITWRYPIAVSSSFGLLHGFGFAGVLQEIGLPQTEVPTALLFFNIGVELGQLFFVFALIVLVAALRRLVPWLRTLTVQSALDKAQRPTAYLVGCLASFWVFERFLGTLG